MIRPGPTCNTPLPEGDWAGHPCCRTEYPDVADDRPRVLWSSPDVRGGVFASELRILSYGLIPGLSSFDPFSNVNQEIEEKS